MPDSKICGGNSHTREADMTTRPHRDHGGKWGYNIYPRNNNGIFGFSIPARCQKLGSGS